MMGLALAALVSGGGPAPTALPARVKSIVLHVPGHPSYDRPDRRFVFYAPPATQALWRRRFGTHWILWVDGSLWPRHPAAGDPSSRMVPVDGPADEGWKALLAAEAAPVYAHVQGSNADSVGIEVSHSGRSGDPFPEVQVRALAWLLESLLAMSSGRLGPESILGHKDLDGRPAYAQPRCERAGCPVFVDAEGRPFRRRVDPPESLFDALRRQGIDIPRPPAADADLLRAEALPAGLAARTARR